MKDVLGYFCGLWVAAIIWRAIDIKDWMTFTFAVMAFIALVIYLSFGNHYLNKDK